MINKNYHVLIFTIVLLTQSHFGEPESKNPQNSKKLSRPHLVQTPITKMYKGYIATRIGGKHTITQVWNELE
jgi:hypothetical protein